MRPYPICSSSFHLHCSLWRSSACKLYTTHAIIIPSPVANEIVDRAFGLAGGNDGSGEGAFGFAENTNSLTYRRALRIAQNTTLTCFVICLIVWSFPFLQQYHSPFRNPRRYFSLPWLGISIAIFVAQIFFMLAMINDQLPRFFIWNVWLLPAAAPVYILILVAEFTVKYRYRKWFLQEQAFMKLEFNTKLGMHSPVSPFS